MICRERRSWTEQEDELLRDAVQREDPDGHPPSKWHNIAKHVPNRTNKDCRKRWFAKMASVVAKGGWSAEEDEKLLNAVERHGTKWSIVASMVQTRNNDQCAKRWSDTLNPNIDRTTWSAEEDAQLLDAVEKHGKSWTKIVKMYFPGRTGLSAKNRYSRLTRISADSVRGTRSRRKSIAGSPDGGRRRSSTVTSSCSELSSPMTHHITFPDSPYSLLPDLQDSLSNSEPASTPHSLTSHSPSYDFLQTADTKFPVDSTTGLNFLGPNYHPTLSLKLSDTPHEAPSCSAFDHLTSPSTSESLTGPLPPGSLGVDLSYPQDFFDHGIFDHQSNPFPWPSQYMPSDNLYFSPSPQSMVSDSTGSDHNFIPIPPSGADQLVFDHRRSPAQMPDTPAFPPSGGIAKPTDAAHPQPMNGDIHAFLDEATASAEQSSTTSDQPSDNRVSVAVAVATCDPWDLHSTVQTLMHSLWGSLSPSLGQLQ